jgi:Protein of unknown function (DUF3592)
MIDLGSVVGLFIIIFTCIIMRPCFFFWRKRRQLRLHGVTVQGQVIEHYQERSVRGLPWYYLTCRYSYEGQTYISDQPVWRDQYERGEQFVSVCCLPDNPEVATVFGDDFQRTENLPTTILGMIFILGGVFILIRWFPNILSLHILH